MNVHVCMHNVCALPIHYISFFAQHLTSKIFHVHYVHVHVYQHVHMHVYMYYVYSIK